MRKRVKVTTEFVEGGARFFLRGRQGCCAVDFDGQHADMKVLTSSYDYGHTTENLEQAIQDGAEVVR